jgi:TetR/AcrR family transcriptional regulator, transcriptional repressor for nem operon
LYFFDEQSLTSRGHSECRAKGDVSSGIRGGDGPRYLRRGWRSAGLFHQSLSFQGGVCPEVLDRYFANLQGFVREALEDKSLTPRQRLKRYLDIISGVLAGAKWNRGCLIGDFSLETTSQSKLLRQRLEAIFQEWRAPFVSCIAEAQTTGEIDSTFDPVDLAEFLLASWEGAILRMKVERGPAPLERFKKIVFQTVFKEQI